MGASVSSAKDHRKSAAPTITTTTTLNNNNNEEEKNDLALQLPPNAIDSEEDEEMSRLPILQMRFDIDYQKPNFHSLFTSQISKNSKLHSHSKLPKEMLISILSFCDILSICKFQRASKYCYLLTTSPEGLLALFSARCPVVRNNAAEVTPFLSFDDVKPFFQSSLLQKRHVDDDSVKERVDQLLPAQLNCNHSPGIIIASSPDTSSIAQFGFGFVADSIQFLISSGVAVLMLQREKVGSQEYKLFTLQSTTDEQGYTKIHARSTKSPGGAVVAATSPANTSDDDEEEEDVEEVDVEMIDVTDLFHSRLLCYYRDGLMDRSTFFFETMKALYSILYREWFANGCVDKHVPLRIQPGRFWTFRGDFKTNMRPVIERRVNPKSGGAKSTTPLFTPMFKKECKFGYHTYTDVYLAGMHTYQHLVTMTLYLDAKGFAVNVDEQQNHGTDRDPRWS